jgi:hypothetical protein
MASRIIVFATVTLARGAEEAELIERALGVLAGLGMPIVATDGGSPAEFVAAVRRIQNIELLTNNEPPGLIGQVRTSLRRARELAAAGGRDDGAILYTEPDKETFFRGGLAAFLDDAGRAEADDGLVLASRSAASFRTYPASQQYAEDVINTVCGSLTGLEADYSYGPFLMAAELIDSAGLERLPASLGWGWRPYLFVRAHRMGRPVRRVEGEFPCPAGQRADSDAERRHRLKQLSQNLAGVVEAIDAA